MKKTNIFGPGSQRVNSLPKRYSRDTQTNRCATTTSSHIVDYILGHSAFGLTDLYVFCGIGIIMINTSL